MSTIYKLAKNSGVYSLASVLQKAFGLLLLPLYTRFLTPDDYGIIAVVNSITSLLIILFTLSLNGAARRFYFDFKDEPEKLKRFWGTIFTFIFLSSVILGSILLVYGKYIFNPVLNKIPFYPYMAIGILIIMFAPFSDIYLSILQITEKVKLYAIISLAKFLLTVLMTISLVVGFKMGALGPLLSAAICTFLFFVMSLFLLREQFKICLDLKLLSSALKYSLPIIPHNVAGTVKSMTDKLFINAIVSSSATGLYNIGMVISSPLGLIIGSINRSFYPIFMNAMARKDDNLYKEIKKISLFLVFMYCFLASGVSIFSEDIIKIFTTKEFHGSFVVVPFISFNSALQGIYFLFVNTLFYIKRLVKYVSYVTVTSVFFNIALNYFFVVRWGIVGAAIATLITKIFSVSVIGFIEKRHSKIMWPNLKFSILFGFSFIYSIVLTSYVNISDNALVMFSFKLLLYFLLFFILSCVCWKNPLFLIKEGNVIISKLIKKREITY